MAGISSWSPVWYKTQPVIAQKTRVHAFDRPSYGFSDPAPRPQILSDTVNDLHAALKAAPIPGPHVLVGHSLGGMEARLSAQRWPKDVVGIIKRSGHEIQLDKPQAVIDAVDEVLRQVQTRAKS